MPTTGIAIAVNTISKPLTADNLYKVDSEGLLTYDGMTLPKKSHALYEPTTITETQGSYTEPQFKFNKSPGKHVNETK